MKIRPLAPTSTLPWQWSLDGTLTPSHVPIGMFSHNGDQIAPCRLCMGARLSLYRYRECIQIWASVSHRVTPRVAEDHGHLKNVNPRFALTRTQEDATHTQQRVPRLSSKLKVTCQMKGPVPSPNCRDTTLATSRRPSRAETHPLKTPPDPPGPPGPPTVTEVVYTTQSGIHTSFD